MIKKGSLSGLEKEIIDILQQDFPLVPGPFDRIGRKTGVTGSQVIECIAGLKEKNVIRQISAIYNTDKMGFTGTLAAFKTDPGLLERTADLINHHPGVSHNYRRDGRYNLWFTIAVPAGFNLKKQINALAARTGVSQVLILPKIKAYKRKVIFRVSGSPKEKHQEPDDTRMPGNISIPAMEKSVEQQIMKELSLDLELCARPFGEIGRKWGFEAEEVLAFLKHLISERKVSRFAAIIKNNTIGFTKNAMVVWNIAEHLIEPFCTKAAEYELVSHCYTRERCPDWYYNVYTMIHGTSEEHNNRIMDELEERFGKQENKVLYSTYEYKKQRIDYFSSAYADWEN